MVRRRSSRQYALNSPALALAQELQSARPARHFGFVEPALATLAERPRSGDRWVHEIKFDGYRIQLHCGDVTKFFTRRGYDWTPRFKEVAAATAKLKTHSAIIGGEVIVPTETGVSDFGALESELGAGRSDKLVFYAFDLLYLDGLDLRPVSLIDRKRVLAELLAEAGSRIKNSEHLEAPGATVLKNACKMELEGIVSKLVDGPYTSGRTHNWVKVTCRQRETFAIVGWAEKAGKFDGVYLGRAVEGKLEYAGKVEHGFSDQSARGVVERLRPLLQRAQALNTKIKKPKARWVKPLVLADVEYRALTGEGLMRHPSFKGVREDLDLQSLNPRKSDHRK
jgi:bifunctional non-homologous end joining protein LigD